MRRLAIIQLAECIYCEYTDAHDVSVEAAFYFIYGTVNWIIRLVARIILFTYRDYGCSNLEKTKKRSCVLSPGNCLRCLGELSSWLWQSQWNLLTAHVRTDSIYCKASFWFMYLYFLNKYFTLHAVIFSISCSLYSFSSFCDVPVILFLINFTCAALTCAGLHRRECAVQLMQYYIPLAIMFLLYVKI